jgi:tRNA-5-methyluridine54 2-sulfurtransferase
MRCTRCDEHAVIDQPALCKAHFIEKFEQRVWQTIDKYQLIPHGSNVAVAVSGGKDSLTVLTLLHKSYRVTAIAIDEGIVGYRERTLEDARRLCAKLGIPLLIRSFKDLTGMTLDEMLEKRVLHPCAICGAFRRHLLNIAAKGFDVLATGHNADDESQAVLMKIIKGNTEIFPRLGPISGADINGKSGARKGFVRRIKPLYFCTEKEVMTYAFITGLADTFVECPYAEHSYRGMIRDELNCYAQSHPGVKVRLLQRFLATKQELSVACATSIVCDMCGEPASTKVCRACSYLSLMKDDT